MDSGLKGKRVTVMGLGLHGGALGTIEWLVEQGAKVTATDLKTEADLAPTLEKLSGHDIAYVLGEHREQDFTETDLVIRNPGVPKGSPFLQAAREANVPIEMDSSLFFAHCPGEDIIGVTGSKGKTTAAKAITAVLEAGGKNVVEVGTDGNSPLGKLKEINEATTVVFELSSWRLEALEPMGISPRIAVVTSIYREHLNTYDSFEDYVHAKKTIVRHQTADDIAILNGDDAELRRWEADAKGQLIWYSKTDAPQEAQLLGVHQRQNLVPAMLIGKEYGIADDVIARAVADFPPLPHRLEMVREKNGVTFINDSASTMPDATIAALEALGDKSIVLILGGNDKQLEFEALAQKVSVSNIGALVWLPGTATERMKEAVVDQSSLDAATMEEAVRLATEQAQPCDTVLLSPGATSFGLFKHEFDRGDQFRAAVMSL